MPWVRLDDSFPDHPKILAAGPAAAWLYVAALCYSARQLTDGFVPVDALRLVTKARNPCQIADKLVDAGLFERAEGGYLIHDFTDYNPSRSDVQNRRKATADRVAGWRRKQACNSVTSAPEPAGNAVSNAAPVPVPSHDPSHDPSPSGHDGPKRQEKTERQNGAKRAPARPGPSAPQSKHELWREVVEEAVARDPPAETWLRHAEPKMLTKSGEMVVTVPHADSVDWLRSARYRPKLEAALSERAGRPIVLEVQRR